MGCIFSNIYYLKKNFNKDDIHGVFYCIWKIIFSFWVRNLLNFFFHGEFWIVRICFNFLKDPRHQQQMYTQQELQQQGVPPEEYLETDEVYEMEGQEYWENRQQSIASNLLLYEFSSLD